MTDEELAALVDRIAAEGGMGGLEVGTLYGDFALDVAKAVREECAKACDKIESAAMADDKLGRSDIAFGKAAAAEACALAIRGQN